MHPISKILLTSIYYTIRKNYSLNDLLPNYTLIRKEEYYGWDA
jgi:hypothetical protein